MGLAWGGGYPFEALRWDMVEATGWTLEYIDSLPFSEVQNYLGIRDGRAKARGSIRNKK